MLKFIKKHAELITLSCLVVSLILGGVLWYALAQV